MFANIADTIFADIRTLIVGKAFSANILGFYTQAKQYPQAISTNINSSIGSVMLPALSSVQEKIETVKSMTRRAIKTSTYLVFPVLMGFAAISDSFVLLVLSEKWAPSIILIKILCIMFLFEPMITINSQARNSIGKSGIHLVIVTIGKTTDIGILLFTWLVYDTIEAIAIGQVVSSATNAILGGFVNKKLIGYKIREQLIDVMPNLLLSVLMFGAVYAITLLHWSYFVTLITQLLVGGIVYFTLSKVFKNQNYDYIKAYISQKMNRKHEVK